MKARRWAVAVVMSWCVATTAAGAPNDPMGCEAMRADARLEDVAFVDATHGWAVGDRGVIWQTDDGGRSWRLQLSGVDCPLRSVCFLNDQIGWAAGGDVTPYTHASTGVILTTGDGGRTWTAAPSARLPSIHRIRFFDGDNGFALGATSALYGSGAFVTKDGGRQWHPVLGPGGTGWSTGDFVDLHTGALAGQLGTNAPIRRGVIDPSRSPSFGLRGLADLQLVPPSWGWLVGDGALVMLTADLGISWQSPPGSLPPGIVGNFDFAAIDVRGPSCWIAGSPGTRILHTKDAGHTWTALPTGQSTPILAIRFVDDQHGWAVGSLGTILATDDGGQSWRVQRAGGRRAAVLVLTSEPDAAPWELLARLGGNEGYLAVVGVVNRRDVEASPASRVPVAERLHAAALRVGATDTVAAWQFPLRQPGLGLDGGQILQEWDRANDGRGLDTLIDYLVRQIRLWQPEIIVTHDASPRGERPREHLINQAVLEASRRAADPTAHVQQITHAGLEPWEVKKIFAALPPDTHGSNELAVAEVADRLGGTLAEIAADARALIDSRRDAGPETLGFHLMVDGLGRGPDGDFFSGIILEPGGDARRRLEELAPDAAANRRRLAQQRQNLRAIFRRSEKDPFAGQQWLAQAGELVRGMDDTSAGRVLYHLAQQYRASGRWPLAAETLDGLVERYPNHPLADAALAWLVEYYASGEAAWRVAGAERAASGGNDRPVVTTLAVDPAQQENRPERAAEIVKYIDATRPELAVEPRIGFPLAAANRARGFPREAERFFMIQQRSASHDAWWAAAQSEAWLADPTGQPAKSVMHCVVAGAKPRLDGRLDEPFWQQAKPAELVSPRQDDQPWPATVKLARDEAFLYIGIECRRPPGAASASSSGPRPRDGDLSAEDRVDVLLDIDRDYVTYYRLTIDHRGWPGEDCWGDPTWNPEWFIATDEHDGAWTAEAAIGLDQLTGRYPKSRDVWAVGLQRVVPGLGFQSWTTPASTTVVPEGFGLLIFE